MTIKRLMADPRTKKEKIMDEEILELTEYHKQLDAMEILIDGYGLDVVGTFVELNGPIKHCCKHHDERFLSGNERSLNA